MANQFHRLHALRMANDAAGYAMDEIRGRFDRLRLRHENGTAPQAVSAFQLFQTPPELADRLVDALNVQAGERLLEPSAGLGRLIDAALKRTPKEIVAVEIAADCARVLFERNTPSVTLLQRDFLLVDPLETAPFDAVLMNPPFKNGSDIRHVRHAMRFLRPGGRLASFCYDGPRQAEVLKPLALNSGGIWEPLGPGAFHSSNTNASTVILTINSEN